MSAAALREKKDWKVPVETPLTPETTRRNLETLASRIVGLVKLLGPLLDDPDFDYQLSRNGFGVTIRSKPKGSSRWTKESASVLTVWP